MGDVAPYLVVKDEVDDQHQGKIEPDGKLKADHLLVGFEEKERQEDRQDVGRYQEACRIVNLAVAS